MRGLVSRDLGGIFNIPSNIEDPSIRRVMAKELKQLRDMISNVPTIIQPIPEASTIIHMVSIFSSPIYNIEVQKLFMMPHMKMHDGTADPEELFAQYREHIDIVPIPQHLKEANLCKGFGLTLT